MRYEISYIPAHERESLINRVYSYHPAIVERMKAANVSEDKKR
jgi:hypothetical protein